MDNHKLKMLSLLLCLGAFISCNNSTTDDNSYRYKLPVTQIPEEKSIPEGDSKNPQFLNEKAEYLFKLGKRDGDEEALKQAEALSRESLRLLPKDNVVAKLAVAQIVELRHHFSEAITLATEVIAESPNNKKAYLILTTSNLAMGKVSEASKAIDSLAKQFPRVGVLSLRGLVFISQGREEEGVFELEKSITLEDIGELSESTWARCILARHFMKRNRMKDAEILLSEALRISPESPLALDLMAQLLTFKNEPEKAVQNFDQAFSVSRQLAHLRHQAELNSQIGKKQLALDQWSQVEKLIRDEMGEDRLDHRIDLVKVLLMRKGPADAKESVGLILEELKIRQNAEIYYLLALAHQQLGNTEYALEAILAYHRIGVRTTEAYDLTSEIYAKLQNESRSKLYRNLSKSLSAEKMKILFF